jgi:shikimate dehydrogenase
MLVAQAALASELFTGNSVPAETVENVYTDILREKRNLVLIGMPGSGKTTVGKIAASKLGRKIVDLDEMIQNIAGKPIREIFAQDGEAAFRELEAQAVREIAGLTGLVIATGGGCILRPENVDRLRRNGLLFLLDRAVDQLLPTGDRPLADTARKLKQLYSQRMPLYRAAADQIIAVNGNETETSDTVIRRFIEET